MSDDEKLGEKRLKRRNRQSAALVIFAVTIGIVFGASLAFLDDGLGSIIGPGAPSAKLDPLPAILLSLCAFVGLVLLPLYTLFKVDELERANNYYGAVAGAFSVWGSYPIWALLHAGGIVGPPDAFGIFLICVLSTLLTYTWARFIR